VKWLTWGGAAAALLVGGATVWGVGWRGFWLLLAFFVSASLLTRGGGRRNARQVVANGGIAAAAALLGAWPAFAGALAAAAADTWATEIGAFSPSPPRLITTGAPVPRGASGGITPLGTAGGVLGAAVIAGLAYALTPRGTAPGLTHPGELAAAVAVAGVVGMLVDSLLGATLQGSFGDEPVQPKRGYAWLDNDTVNLAATLAGAGIAAAGWRLCC
jgi:uncharacterized protein (TIGR00297 family)